MAPRARRIFRGLPSGFDGLRVDACEALGIISTGKVLEGLKRLNRLTPGDFAAVLRQGRSDPITSDDALIDRLAAECRLKGGAPRRSSAF